MKIIHSIITFLATALLVSCIAYFGLHPDLTSSEGHFLAPHPPAAPVSFSSDFLLRDTFSSPSPASPSSLARIGDIYSRSAASPSQRSAAEEERPASVAGSCALKNYPVKCGNGTFCCTAGTRCWQNYTCRYRCPTAYPVDCMDGSCCGTGYNCSGYRTCLKAASPPSAATKTCVLPTNKTCGQISTGQTTCCASSANCTSDPAVCQGHGWGCPDSAPNHCLGTGKCCPKDYTCLKFGGCGSCTVSSTPSPNTKLCFDDSKMWCCHWTAQCGPNASLQCISGCFDADALVRVRRAQGDVHRVALRRLQIGDWVESVDAHDKPTFSRVYYIAHAREEAFAPQLELVVRSTGAKDEEGTPLRMTPHHLVYRTDARGVKRSAVAASALKAGDWIMRVVDGETVPVQVGAINGPVIKQILNPLTENGRIVVSDIVCSVFTTNEQFYWLLTLPLRSFASYCPACMHSPAFLFVMDQFVKLSDLFESLFASPNSFGILPLFLTFFHSS